MIRKHGDLLTMKIQFVYQKGKKTEIVSSAHFSKVEIDKRNRSEKGKRIAYRPYSYRPAYKAPIGTLLVDFLSANFDYEKSFLDFVDKWGFAGLCEHSKAVETISVDRKDYSERKYKEFIACAWGEVSFSLQEGQKQLLKLVHFCLDLQGPSWTRGLTPEQRFFLMRYLKDANNLPIIDKYINNLTNIFEVTPKDQGMLWGMDNEKRPRPLLDLHFDEIVKRVRENAFNAVEGYESKDIIAICYVEFKEMLISHSRLRKCSNCGKYFLITGRIDSEYCDRLDDLGRTCKKIGPLRKYTDKPNKDPIVKIYRKAYKTLYARMARHSKPGYRGKEAITYADFEKWKLKASEKMAECQKGKISLEDFEEWINSSVRAKKGAE